MLPDAPTHRRCRWRTRQPHDRGPKVPEALVVKGEGPGRFVRCWVPNMQRYPNSTFGIGEGPGRFVRCWVRHMLRYPRVLPLGFGEGLVASFCMSRDDSPDVRRNGSPEHRRDGSSEHRREPNRWWGGTDVRACDGRGQCPG